MFTIFQKVKIQIFQRNQRKLKGKILVFFDANNDEVNANVRDVHDDLKNPQNNGKLRYQATGTKFGTKHPCEKGI